MNVFSSICFGILTALGCIGLLSIDPNIDPNKFWPIVTGGLAACYWVVYTNFRELRNRISND